MTNEHQMGRIMRGQTEVVPTHANTAKKNQLEYRRPIGDKSTIKASASPAPIHRKFAEDQMPMSQLTLNTSAENGNIKHN